MPYRFIKEANQALSDKNYPKEQTSDVRHLKSTLAKGIKENEEIYQGTIAPGLRKKMECANEQRPATQDSDDDSDDQDNPNTMEFSFGSLTVDEDRIKKALQWYKYDRVQYNGLFKGHKATNCPQGCDTTTHEWMTEAMTGIAEKYIKLRETQQLKDIALNALARGSGHTVDVISEAEGGVLDADT
jgi:hypothetical protein